MKTLYTILLLSAVITSMNGATQNGSLRKEAARENVLLAYRFSFEKNGEQIDASVFVRFSAEKFAYPGADFPSTPSGSMLALVSRGLGTNLKLHKIRQSLSAEETMEFLGIIAQSEVFSLPTAMAGPEPRNAVAGGSFATFERFYSGAGVIIERNPLASLPTRDLIVQLHEFFRKEAARQN